MSSNCFFYYTSTNKVIIIMVLERVEIVSYNKQYVAMAKTRNFKFNRTHTGTNFTLKMITAFGNDLQVLITCLILFVLEI